MDSYVYVASSRVLIMFSVVDIPYTFDPRRLPVLNCGVI